MDKLKISKYWSLKAFIYSIIIAAVMTLIIKLMMEEKLPLDSIIIRSIATGIFMLVPYILTEAVWIVTHMDILNTQYYAIAFFSYMILFYWIFRKYFSLRNKDSKKNILLKFSSIYFIAAALCAIIFISYYYFW